MKKVKWYISIPVLVLFLVASFYVLNTSSYVRYWADDFCSSVLLRNNGYWQSQIIWWNSWTGRFSATFFTGLAEILGQNFVNILPLILFVLFTVSLYLVFGLPIALLLTVIFFDCFP
ncbi:MAG: hypothetical protein QY322_01535 [bacterium]|nr:MAG: hypothetical protein QY322_01535 [bacterium]